jgi:hypothetical protein
MQSTCTIGGDANDMQEHGNGCKPDAFVRSEGFQGWQDSSCLLLQYHQINDETCLRDGEIRQSRRLIFIAIVISSLM